MPMIAASLMVRDRTVMLSVAGAMPAVGGR